MTEAKREPTFSEVVRKSLTAALPRPLIAWLCETLKRLGYDRRRFLLQRVPEGAVCAEVGVWKGDFSEKILRTVKPRELHLVDPWQFVAEFPDRDYGRNPAEGQNRMDAVYQGVVERLSRFEAVRIHRATSLEAAATFPDEYFDWVYIDGDHSEAAVYADLQAYKRKLKPGGLLAGDDYDFVDSTGRLSDAVGRFAAEHGLDLRVRNAQFILQV
jgi:hypothetical protein